MKKRKKDKNGGKQFKQINTQAEAYK